MKKIFFSALIIILITSCEEKLSTEQINKVTEIVENEGFVSLEDANLTKAEIVFGNCFRQCRKSFKDIKRPKKISIGAADLKKFNLPSIEYNTQSYTDSDFLYKAFITTVKAHCIGGCISKENIGPAVSEEVTKYYEALKRLADAKVKIEDGKQSENKGVEEKSKGVTGKKSEQKETSK